MSVLRSPLISFTENLHNNRWYQEETVGILSSSSFIKVIVIIDDCQGFHGVVMNHSFPQKLTAPSSINDSHNFNAFRGFRAESAENAAKSAKFVL